MVLTYLFCLNSLNVGLRQRGIVRACSVPKLCPFCSPMDCSLPGCSVHGISQARILAWVAFPFPGDLPDGAVEPESCISNIGTGKPEEGHIRTFRNSKRSHWRGGGEEAMNLPGLTRRVLQMPAWDVHAHLDAVTTFLHIPHLALARADEMGEGRSPSTFCSAGG